MITLQQLKSYAENHPNSDIRSLILGLIEWPADVVTIASIMEEEITNENDLEFVVDVETALDYIETGR